MKSSGWGSWIRTNIDGVRVRNNALIQFNFPENEALFEPLNINGMAEGCKL